MNTYLAIYKDKKIDVEAETSYKAQQEAAKIFKAKKTYQVTVYPVVNGRLEVACL